MEQRILTLATMTVSTAHSRIRSELLGNFPSGATKFTVVHRRPVTFSSQCPLPKDAPQPNSMCRFAYHPVLTASNDKTESKKASDQVVTHPTKKASPSQPKSLLKRSLSADHIDIFSPAPAKRPFPVQIWFNNRRKGPCLPVATAYWQDSPLHDSLAFVYIKLLEASQARRYLQLQSKPRKYLHLTGGGIQAVVPPPPSRQSKPEIILPPMVVKVTNRPNARPSPPQQAVKSGKKILAHQLPPPPPLISLNHYSTSPVAQNQEEQPLELCNKRRKPSVDSSSPLSPGQVVSTVPSAPSSPLNLAFHYNDRASLIQSSPSTSSSVTTGLKRKISLPPIALPSIVHQQNEPLDLATPSPTAAFHRLTLNNGSESSPIKASPSSCSPPTDPFLQRLALVLPVLLGHRRLAAFGHPQMPIEAVLARVLRKAGIEPAEEVRPNWLKFLRLCVKNEDAWNSEGWDKKTADDILDEIYTQDVGPILRKSENRGRLVSTRLFIKEEDVKQSVA